MLCERHGQAASLSGLDSASFSPLSCQDSPIRGQASHGWGQLCRQKHVVSLRDASEEANCQLASHWLKCVYHMAQQKSLNEEALLLRKMNGLCCRKVARMWESVTLLLCHTWLKRCSLGFGLFPVLTMVSSFTIHIVEWVTSICSLGVWFPKMSFVGQRAWVG